MPSPNPTTRREFKGAAKSTTLSAQIVNGTDTTFTVADASGWPTGGVGKFVVTINAGLTDEEKILCLSRSGTTVTVDTRGFDSTIAAGHASGATAVHSWSAFDADEVNQHTNASSGVHGVTGAVVGTTDTQVLTNKTLTAPAISAPAFSGTATGSLTALPLASPAFSGTATGTLNTSGDVQVGGASYPRGRMAGTTLNAQVTASAGTESAIFSDIAFTAVAGRRYRVHVTLTDCQASGAGTKAWTVRLRDGGAGATTNASTQLHEQLISLAVAPDTRTVAFTIDLSGLSAGTHTLNLYNFANANTIIGSWGSATAGHISYFTIDDIGT